MKFNLKVIAAAVALAAAGSAHADFVGGGNSTLVLAAINTVTNTSYFRDTGFLMNTFLPSSVTTAAGDGGVTGNKTPEAGLLLDKTNTVSFSDSAFVDWLGGASLSDIRWTTFAVDASSQAGTNNVSRLTLALASPTASQLALITNNTITNAAPIGNFLLTLNPAGLSTTTSSVVSNVLGNLIGQNATLGTLNVASSLYYFARSQGTLANATPAVSTLFQNSANVATVTLESDGDFIYSLAPAAAPSPVPVPAAAWLLGSGLLAMGGAARRRKAKASAEA